ncbi:glutamate synthase large subunit [Agrilactobacillus composti DSM 18527 = JCM 14202]|uniref:Glutamate synthase large subunit n=2 Tax=Agrilactobacillus TaxID=2767875 RepID=A0A0R1Y3L6_9LACO|nr:glutamate synthase large subunit [Agrilactobacillus composti DSM 18527 = JCM 14202]
MGFITQINGKKSHWLLEQALTMLQRMNHRGGTGSEPDTGDGAGVLLQISDPFFQKEAQNNGFKLPAAGYYAVGQFFVPQKQSEKEAVLRSVTEEIQNAGIDVLGSRDVPFIYEACGPTAQKIMPGFVQVFLAKPGDIELGRNFEDVLYKLRRHLEKTFSSDDELSIVSLSSQTIVYKGMLHAYQVGLFYPDLHDETMISSICLVHSRFSTNTFPSWDRAQPYRFLAHNGEINTLKGGENWMTAHNVEIYNEGDSDSAKLENCMEYLYRHGRDIPEALLMMVPEAWAKTDSLPAAQRAFDEYNDSFMSPWDGPAALCFTDGTQVGAALDRNGLRPSRYILDDKGILVVASESGVMDMDPQTVVKKGILGPADMILVDTKVGKFYETDEIKAKYAKKYPYEQWIKDNQLTLAKLPAVPTQRDLTHDELELLWRRHGYTDDIIREAILPMAQKGEEPIISMGFDSPLAVLSHKPQSLFTYFKQQFAQVTNPPIDAIREDFVIGTEMFLGRDDDITRPLPANAQKIRLDAPILANEDFEKISHLNQPGFKAATISVAYKRDMPAVNRLEQALDDMFKAAESQVDAGATLLILSDQQAGEQDLVIPILLATAGLNNYLVKKGKRGKASLIIASGEPCEVHHYATLLGYGASAIYPYGAYQTLKEFKMADAIPTYVKACIKGIVKIMSRMGISTVNGYQGAQLFEAIGLNSDVVDKYFSGTPSRIGGIGLKAIEQEYYARYEKAYGPYRKDDLASGGSFKYRVNGEHHLYNPVSLFKFQDAIRTGNYDLFKEYTKEMNQEAQDNPTTLRSMWYFDYSKDPVPLSEVEPIETIVKRFKSGAMSYGALSEEAHETIAEAMNALGAKSNSGEGGENRTRFALKPDGRNLNSKIKQVASARFGVNAEYLMSAEEIQIKMAQGAKPGEGGQLAAKKNYPWVAECRGATPGVRLISPPPHHDIYSIEDLKQLIFDLKQVNPYAKITVKLVATTGVGTIATGVVKAGADKVTISGYDGGTGAAPRTSVRDAGIPWEMGVADAHQTLWLNNLRQRTTIETDGKLMTGRDIAVATMLGAEEFSFGSLTLCAIGCIMMRVCSLNTCPTGICTQDPNLRKNFIGKPEHIENMMRFLAEDLREIMAKLGYRTIDEMVGHTEHLKPRFVAKGKARHLNFDKILGASFGIKRKQVDPFEEKYQWPQLDDFAQSALKQKGENVIRRPINNVQRAVGSRMGGWIAQHFGNQVLEPGKIKYQFEGIAGQSFGAFITQGLELKLIGEANDYVGKGLSGGRLIVQAPPAAKDLYSNSTVVGNVACFGATSGQAFFNGRAGERFCVRNSGADVVVEGIGDHGCEYMTGGHVVILGSTGQNFGAGMSGGIAYVYDPEKTFAAKLNPEMVDLLPLEATDQAKLHDMLADHLKYTQSTQAQKILDAFEFAKKDFVKVYPKDFHHINDIIANLEKQSDLPQNQILEKAFEIAVAQD